MNISKAFTFCPNDLFMFYGLQNNKISHNFNFTSTIADIELLNICALEGLYDITKASVAIIPFVDHKYQYLRSGAAFGINGGPILVSKIDKELTDSLNIGLPGLHTTANVLFQYYYKKPHKKKYLHYKEIIDSILNDEIDAGVIIHEDRFTYESKGLKCLMDFGILWFSETSLPLPLGVILVKKTLDYKVIVELEELIQSSIKIAFEQYSEAVNWIYEKTQRKEDKEILKKHINFFVNTYSLNLNTEAEKAIERLCQIVRFCQTIN